MRSKSKHIPRLGVPSRIQDQSSTNTSQTMSVVRRSGEKIRNMYRCRSPKVLVDAISYTNPKRNEKRCEGNYAKSKVTCSSSYFPQCHYECMDGDYLVSCTSVF